MGNGKSIKFLKSYFVSKLDWLENKVELDINYYLKNVPSFLIITVVTIVFGLISSVIFARLTSPEVYGSYLYVLTIISTLSIFSISGMDTAVQRASGRGNDRVLNEGTKTRFKWSIIGSLVIIGLGFYYLFNGNMVLGKCFLVASFFFPFYTCFDTFLYFLKGKMRFYTFTFYQSLLTIIPVLVVVTTILLTNDLFLITVSYLSVFSILQTYMWFRTTKKCRLNSSMDPEAIRYGKTLTLQGLIPNFVSQLDNIIIANYLSLSDLAIFSIAVYGQNFATTPRGIIQDLIFPKIACMENEKGTKAVLEKIKYVLILSILICAIFAVLIPVFLPLLYSTKYSASIFYAELLLISEIVASPGGVFTQALKAQGRSKDLWNLTISTRSVEAVLFIIMIPLFGLLGAVIVRIINNLITTVVSFFIFKKICK